MARRGNKLAKARRSRRIEGTHKMAKDTKSSSESDARGSSSEKRQDSLERGSPVDEASMGTEAGASPVKKERTRRRRGIPSLLEEPKPLPQSAGNGEDSEPDVYPDPELPFTYGRFSQNNILASDNWECSEEKKKELERVEKEWPSWTEEQRKEWGAKQEHPWWINWQWWKDTADERAIQYLQFLRKKRSKRELEGPRMSEREVMCYNYAEKYMTDLIECRAIIRLFGNDSEL